LFPNLSFLDSDAAIFPDTVVSSDVDSCRILLPGKRKLSSLEDSIKDWFPNSKSSIVVSPAPPILCLCARSIVSGNSPILSAESKKLALAILRDLHDFNTANNRRSP
jgi:hypothetical protein